MNLLVTRSLSDRREPLTKAAVPQGIAIAGSYQAKKQKAREATSAPALVAAC